MVQPVTMTTRYPVDRRNLTRLPEPVVVLGGGGFIGSRLVERLVSERYDVIAVDIEFPEFRNPYLEGASRWTIDLRTPGGASQACHKAGTVFHFAADMGGVGWFHSDRDWGSSLTNSRISTNVLEQAVRSDVQRLVYASSACAAATEGQSVVGHAYPITEGDLRWGTPDALYGAEKRHTAWMVEHAPIDGRVGVFHTIYGPGQEHEGPRMKFPTAVATKAIAARQTKTLEMWGDGSQLRSYLFIDDAIDRIMRLALAPTNPGPVNIGSDEVITCENIAKLCLDITGVPDAEIIHVDGPTGVASRNADLTKWRSYFGPILQTTSYEEGFLRLIDWLDTL